MSIKKAIGILAVVLCGIAPCHAQQKGGQGKLVVHEWGVLVKEAAAEGTVLTSPAELLNSLPAFAKNDLAKPQLQQLGWDKPILHFYGPEGLEVKAKVGIAQGRVTALWPPAALTTNKYQITDRKKMMISNVTEVVGAEWAFTLRAKPDGKLSEAPKDHWWNLVRQVPSMYLKTKEAQERFVFYEATALEEPPVSATVTADAITLANADDQASGQVLVVVNAADKHYLAVVKSIAARKDLKLTKAEVLKTAVKASEVLAACREHWKSCGMTEQESQAIVSTWADDITKPFTFLVISRMPPAAYDRMFPLEVTPKPAQTVRVGMVFDRLSGQADRLTWMEGLAEYAKAAAKELADNDYKVREAAAGKLARMGSYARPLLESLLKSKDAQVKFTAKKLLGALDAQPLFDPPRPRKGQDAVTIPRPTDRQ